MATETVNKPRIYTLHDFNTIVNEVQFEISQSTIDMINLLANKVCLLYTSPSPRDS